MLDESNLEYEEIGIYKFYKNEFIRSNDNKRLYKCICKYCGFETYMGKYHAKRPKKCTHLNQNHPKGLIPANQIWSNNRIHRIFRDMKRRCYNSNSKDYRWYGAKGIKICEEWLNHPEEFEKWALENGYKDNLTIDRIDENKDYYPENCRWITNIDNAKYKSTTKILEVDGKSYTGREWSEVLDLGPNTINTMLRQYDKEVVKDFIRLRQEDTERKVHRKSHQTWLNAYGIDPEVVS